MAKYCTHCGKEIHEKAVVCVHCGCAVPNEASTPPAGSADPQSIVNVITQRLKTNGIIWIVIAALQIIGGISWDWFLLIVGVCNLCSAVNDITFSQSFLKKPVGVVARVKPLVMPIIVLVYNLVLGGIIGVAGSIYYFIAVRGYVLEREQAFLEIEKQQITLTNTAGKEG